MRFVIVFSLIKYMLNLCNNDLIKSFGYSTQDLANSDPMIMCPNIKNSCCQLSEHYLILRDSQYIYNKNNPDRVL